MTALADEIKRFAEREWKEYWRKDDETRKNITGDKFYETLSKVIEKMIKQKKSPADIACELQHLLGNDGSEVNHRRSPAARLYKAVLNDLDSELVKIDKSDEYDEKGRDAARKEKLDERRAALIVARSISWLYPDLAFDVETTGQKVPLFITAAQYGLTPIVRLMIELVSHYLQDENNLPKGVTSVTALHEKLNVSSQGQSALCWAASKSKCDVMVEILRADPTLSEHKSLAKSLLAPCPDRFESNEQREREQREREDCVRLILEKCPSFARPNHLILALAISTPIANLFLEVAEKRRITMLTNEAATWLIEKGTDEQWDICTSYPNLWAEDIRKGDLDLLHLAVENRRVGVVRDLSDKFPSLAIAKGTRRRYPLQYSPLNQPINAYQSESSDEEQDGVMRAYDGSPSQPATAGQLGSTELQALKDIRDAIVPAVIKAAKSSADASRILQLCNAEAQEICLHLADFNTAAYSFQDYVNSLIGIGETTGQVQPLEFEKVLRYADFPELNCRILSAWDELRKDYQEVYQVLMWLKDSKEVSEVMEVKVLDRLYNPHHHELIAKCVKDLRISSLNWRRLDLYLGGLDPHKSLRTLHLYTSGSPATLSHWFGEKLIKLAKARVGEMLLQQTASVQSLEDRGHEQEAINEDAETFRGTDGMHERIGMANGRTVNKGDVLNGETENDAKIGNDHDEVPCGLWDLKLENLTIHIVEDVLSDQRAQELELQLTIALDLMSRKLRRSNRRPWTGATIRERWVPQTSSTRPTDLEKICLPELKNFIDGYKVLHQSRTRKAAKQASTNAPYKVKIAVIDNGVVLVGNNAKSGICAQIRDGRSFVQKGAEIQPWWHAKGPHGTQMTSLICSIDPCCEIFIARVGDSNISGVTPRRLAMAIEWAMGKHVDIISISIALTVTHRKLDVAVSKAIGHGIAVICSTTDELSSGERTYPAKISGTMKVAACDKYGKMLNWSKEVKESYRINGHGILAGAVPYVTSKERITGNSVATAIAAGLGSLILSCCRLVGRTAPPKDLITEYFEEMMLDPKLRYIEPKTIFSKQGAEQESQEPKEQFDVWKRIRDKFERGTPKQD